MSELTELQRLMSQLLRRRRALPTDPEIRELAARYFGGNDRLGPVEQLEIYRQQFWLRHTAALVEDYPGVGGIVGQRAWERLTEEYLEAHPPTTFTLRDLGAALPDFIAERAAWLEHQALVADMARLEWAYVEVFDAAEPGRLAPERLATLDEAAWADARLSLSPALRLLRVGYPVVELRRQLCGASARSDSGRVPIPAPSPERLLIHRAELVIRVEHLHEAPFRLLEALAEGSSLPEACEAACRGAEGASDVVEAELGRWFENWVKRGIIVDVTRIPT